ncbi:MAG: hypothetical protein GY701_18020, partial [Sulfitobacter sp.]|nr:hypothetical protein [Sulfitobacter sp.]
KPMGFPDELLSFANSMTVDQEIGENLRVVVEEYITRTLEFTEYHVMLSGKTVHNDPGLDTARTGQNPWCNDKAGAIPELLKGSTSCPTQSTYSYKNQIPLWITAKNKNTKQP